MISLIYGSDLNPLLFRIFVINFDIIFDILSLYFKLSYFAIRMMFNLFNYSSCQCVAAYFLCPIIPSILLVLTHGFVGCKYFVAIRQGKVHYPIVVFSICIDLQVVLKIIFQFIFKHSNLGYRKVISICLIIGISDNDVISILFHCVIHDFNFISFLTPVKFERSCDTSLRNVWRK